MAQEFTDDFSGFADTLNRAAEEAGTAAPAAPEPQAQNVPASPQADQADIPFVPEFAEAALVGASKSVLETKDFLGEVTGIYDQPDKGEGSSLRRWTEQREQELTDDSVVNALIIPLSQFVTGFIGAGKIVKGAQLASKGLKAAGTFIKGRRSTRIAGEAIKAAGVGAVVFDPHEERLSNLIESYPTLSNSVTRYLQAKPDDSAAEGRFKTALEGLGMDVAVITPLALGMKAYRYFRAGEVGKARKAAADAQAAMDSVRPTTDASQGELPLEGGAGAKPAVTPDPKTFKEAIEQLRPDEVKDFGTEQAVAPGERKRLVRAFPAQQVGRLYKQFVADNNAVEAYGSRDAAIQAGHRFAKPERVPWQKLNAPEDVTGFYARVVKSREGALNRMKGGRVQRDKHLQEVVRRNVRLWGGDTEKIFGAIAGTGKQAKQMAVHMETADALALRTMDEAYQVASKIQNGQLDEWGGDMGKAMLEFARRTAIATDLVGHARSISSNAGRTLRRMRGDLDRLTVSDMRKLEKLSPEAVLRLMQETEGDIHAIKNLLSRPSLFSRITDYANFLVVNNLLWGWTTHAVNTTSNMFMLLSRPAQRAMGAYGLRAIGAISKDDAYTTTSTAMRQYRYMAGSLHDGLRMALRAAIQGDSILTPRQVEFYRYAKADAKTGADVSFKPFTSAGNLMHNAMAAANLAIGVPTRMLGALDEMMKQTVYRSKVLAEASLEADRDGLTGQAFKDHLRNVLDGSFDEHGRATNMRLAHEARVSTFQQDLLPGTIGASVQKFVSNHPNMRWTALPYVVTPTNVIREGVKLTPGLNVLQREYREMLLGRMGPEQQANAAGQMAMGSLLAGTALAFASSGMITGSGPTATRARQELMATGWKPNTVWWQGEDGKVGSFQVGRFDPIGLTMGVAADIALILQHPDKYEDAIELTQNFAMALVRQMRERTYLLNLKQWLDALSDPDRSFAKTAGSTVRNLIPFSSAFRYYGGEAMSYLREVRRMTDSILATLPHVSDNIPSASDVPLRFDMWGDPVHAIRGPWMDRDTSDVVDEEIIRMGTESDFVLGRPSASPVAGVDLRDITLEDGRNAYSVYQRLAGHPPRSKPLKEAAKTLIVSAAYQKAIDGSTDTRGTRQWMLSGLVSKYRRAAMKRLQAQSPKVREAIFEARRKAAAAFKQSQSDAEDTAAGNKNLQRLRGIMDNFGVDSTHMPRVPGTDQ